MTQTEDILEHYGIKGMKWGVRRTRAQIDADSAEATRKKDIQSKVKKNRTTDVLTNAELQEVITRMNLEQQFQRLNAPPEKAKKSKGDNFVKQLVKKVAQEQLKTAINSTLKPINQQYSDMFSEGIQEKLKEKGKDPESLKEKAKSKKG